MTKQEMFDKVLLALRKQGRASVQTNRDGTLLCLYRAKNGDKCAAGHLLPDELYDPRMEDKTFTEVSEIFGIGGALGMDNSDVLFVRRLQIAHDESLVIGRERWELRMKNLAAFYSLTYTPPANAATGA